MVHAPPVLVLDGPTAGVDVELRQQLWSYLRELQELGTTILLTTHYLEEAQELCDRVAIINKGRVVTCQPTKDILRTIDSKEVVLTTDRDLQTVPENFSQFNVELQNRRSLLFRLPAKNFPLEKIMEAVRKEGLSIVDLETKETDLEDIFLMLTREANNPM